MSQTAAQRKAWNEAMLSAAGSAAVLPAALQPTIKKRTTRSKSGKLSRRERARKSQHRHTEETKEEQYESQVLQAAAWMDALEDVPAGGVGEDADGLGNNHHDGDDDDDSYDELEELEEEYQSTGKKRRRGKKKKAAVSRQKRKSGSNTGALPRRFQVRSLASILSEEVGHPEGAAKEWLDDEARHPRDAAAPFSRKKYCPVTGMLGIYTEPKTGIPYATLPALEQIRERPPPWTTLGGTLAYHEVVRSLRDE
jgi:hypothetical protein